MTALPSDFLAAERILLRGDDTLADRCQAVVAAARRLVALDAFYLCRIDRPAGLLRFLYICDGELYGPGRELPLGDGPTSLVAQSGRPVVIQDAASRTGLSLNPFGGSEPSQSAVHWPLRLTAARSGPADGVLSVQSYRPLAYDGEALAAIEWLALRSSALFGESSDDLMRVGDVG